MQLGGKSLGIGSHGFVNGFGDGFEHAEKNPFMKWIEPIPVKKAE